MKKYFYAVLLLAVAIGSGCKKDKKVQEDSALDKLKDSVYMYALEDYLWNDQLKPASTFNPRSYSGSTDLEALQNEVDALSQVAKNPSTNLAYEYSQNSPGSAKYSFIDDGSTSGELGGQASGDFGFEPRYGADGGLYIKYVYPNSPAAAAGAKRGYKVTKLNGSTSLTPTDANIKNIVDGFYNKTTMAVTLQKPDGSSFDANINTASYTINPVLTYKVFEAGSKKVGYMVFNSFTSLANAQPKIDAAFTLFGNEGVTDLIIDLRYNGGGYVATSDYIANLIVPAAKSGSLMYTYYFNQSLQNDKFTLINKNVFDGELEAGAFKPERNQVKFSKKGSLAISKVVFIVTGSSASASELTINNLLPHLDVKIVGETSYGKPVGFFAIPIDKYELYIPEFETRNSAGNANYYAGMQPGTSLYPGAEIDDDVTKDFGDAAEGCTQAALSYITTGDFLSLARTQSPRLNSTRVLSVQQVRSFGLKLDGPHFKGMIYNKVK